MAPAPTPRALTSAQASLIGEGLGLLKAGRIEAALVIGRRLVAESAMAPDAQQFLAFCLADGGDAVAAGQAFDGALALAPGHPLILANYVDFLCKQGRAELVAGSATQARTTLERAVALQPGSAPAWQALGHVRRACNDLEGSAAALRTAVERAPREGSAWVNLGVVQRLLGRADEAIASFAEAGKLGYARPEAADALSGALLDSGRFEQAVEQARQVIRHHPDFVVGYTTLAHLLWEYGSANLPEDDPIAMFRAAVQARPQDGALRLAFVGFLLMARRADDALAEIKTLQAQSRQPGLAALEANALEIMGRTEQAGALYAQFYRAQGSTDPAFLNAYARHLLRAGKWDAAAQRATEATRIDAGNQEAWAYLGTAWRLLGDPREFWLFDYERLIALVDIEPPAGFADAEDFLVALKSTLAPMHQARREPVQQSLRGGSQTPGRLFGRPNPVIAAAESSLLRAVERWLATLPSDPAHPFLRGKARSVRFSGAWSVKLWSSGSHVNHIHPEGWMSSAFYVSLPPSVRSQAAHSRAGWIQFGEPPRELGLDLPPRRAIRPEPGKLALFPSYMWHGTVPFEDEQSRVTIAFDMLPIQDSP